MSLCFNCASSILQSCPTENMHVISYYIHIIVLFSCAAVISSHPMSSIICIIIVFITELYYNYIFIELLMYFCYNTSYVF